MDLHHHFFDGSRRPGWAGPVRSQSRTRPSGPGRLAQTSEFSGLVLPVATALRSGPALGFPDLAEYFPDLQPGILKNWQKLEQHLGGAAANLMGWSGPSRPYQAAGALLPDNALFLGLSRNVTKSTLPDDAGRLLSPDSLRGEITKMFAIGDVSGTQVRFESAGAAASFLVTPYSAAWSRELHTL